MKHLNRLTPDYHREYMKSGMGQPVNYLKLSSGHALQELKEDVDNGAVQFQELLKLAELETNRVVVINCDNQETGLMAVSYLADIYNEKEGYHCDPEDMDDWSQLYDLAEKAPDEQRDKDEEQDDTDEIFHAFRDGHADDMEEWEENPFFVPVIKAYELYQAESLDTGICHNDMVFQAQRSYAVSTPYWMRAKKEPVCVVCSYMGAEQGSWNRDWALTIDQLKRFQDNRHLYLVMVHQKEGRSSMLTEKDYQQIRDSYGGLVLQLCAQIVSVRRTEKEYPVYRKKLFESWIRKKNRSLCFHFPYKKIMDRIEDLCMDHPYTRLEKIVDYVLDQQETGERVLTEKDFMVLEKFRMLGQMFQDREKNTMRNADQLLYGMDEVKKRVKSIVSVMKYQKYRKEQGFRTNEYHKVFLFLGAPGTAKTTMAELLGQMMFQEKLIPGCRFTAVNGAEMKAEFVGHTVGKVQQLFEDNDVIFIDEAYSIASDDGFGPDSYAQEAISQLLIELERQSDKKLIIFAGYGGSDVEERDNCMKRFLDANPGIRSRISDKIMFSSYQPDEMVHIFEKQAQLRSLRIPDEVKPDIERYYTERRKKSDFGNGREARNLLEHAMKYMAARLMDQDPAGITDEALQELHAQDIRDAIREMTQDYRVQNGISAVRYGFAG